MIQGSLYSDKRIQALAAKAAEDAGKNARVAPQLLFAGVMFMLVDAIEGGELLLPQVKVPVASWDETWDRFEREGHLAMKAVSEEELVAKATGPRVTKDELYANVATYAVFNAYDAVTALGIPASEHLKLLTLAVVTAENGFTFVGESACAWPANYDQDIGNRLALDNAKNKMWSVMSYHLKQQLHTGTHLTQTPLPWAEPTSDTEVPPNVSVGEAAANETWEDRLWREEGELKERLTNLENFLGGPLFEKLADQQKRLLIEQKQAMWSYHTILVARLAGIS